MRATFIVSGRFGVKKYRDAILDLVPLPDRLYVDLTGRSLTVNITLSDFDLGLEHVVRAAICRVERH
jgi:hypothetical protein